LFICVRDAVKSGIVLILILCFYNEMIVFSFYSAVFFLSAFVKFLSYFCCLKISSYIYGSIILCIVPFHLLTSWHAFAVVIRLSPQSLCCFWSSSHDIYPLNHSPDNFWVNRPWDVTVGFGVSLLNFFGPYNLLNFHYYTQ